MISVRDHEFWKDNNELCDVCGGCKCHTCDCPGGPRGPQLQPGIYDLSDRDSKHSDRDH